MTDPSLAATIATNIAIAIANDGALGSPYSLHRLARSIRRLPGESSTFDVVLGSAYLLDACRVLMTTRKPRADYRLLKKVDPVRPHAGPDVFTLCARAIGKAVFLRDWEATAALFELAFLHPASDASSHVRRAVVGLKERYLLLPRTGAGVRLQGSGDDILWLLNHAEERFCQGDLASAQSIAESIVARRPAFGWGRSLLIRIHFSQSDFLGARSVLLKSDIGVLCAAEELAWNTLLPGAEDRGPSPKLAHPTAPSQFRLPLYFRALSSLLRGDVQAGRDLLKTASRSGEPTSLMIDHDPVILLALRRAALPSSLDAESVPLNPA